VISDAFNNKSVHFVGVIIVWPSKMLHIHQETDPTRWRIYSVHICYYSVASVLLRSAYQNKNLLRILQTFFQNVAFSWPCIMLWFLKNDQREAQFFTTYLFLFLFLTLYMFRAHRAHHQERKIVSTQPLVTVTRPPTQSDSYQRLCWHNLSLLMMSTMCSKYVES
jgi:hypothetical protein